MESGHNPQPPVQFGPLSLYCTCSQEPLAPEKSCRESQLCSYHFCFPVCSFYCCIALLIVLWLNEHPFGKVACFFIQVQLQKLLINRCGQIFEGEKFLLSHQSSFCLSANVGLVFARIKQSRLPFVRVKSLAQIKSCSSCYLIILFYLLFLFWSIQTCCDSNKVFFSCVHAVCFTFNFLTTPSGCATALSLFNNNSNIVLN